MKRLTSLVLALLLALTMMVGAFAETADVTGEWYGELLGIQVTLTINADGTYKMDIAGMDSEEGVWEKNEDGNLVMDKGTEGEGLVTVTETGLSTEQDGMKIDFTREAPAEDEETDERFPCPSDAELFFRGAFSFGNSIIMKHPDNNE